MNYKALSWLLAAGVPLAACDVPETSMNITAVIFPEEEEDTGICTYTADSEPQLDVTMDVAGQLSLFLGLRVENKLAPVDQVVNMASGDALTYDQDVTPVRFDYRWECDSIGFSSDLGPMRLPQFSTTQPFCLDSRDDTTRTFVGFDVIPATGGSIEPLQISAVTIRPVPAQLGIAIFDMFALAALAQGCCESTDGCGGVDNAANQACVDLAAAFNDVGIQNHAEETLRYRPFSLFDGTTAPTGGPNGTNQRTPRYPMRMRGILEAVTTSGELVTSNEFAQDIHFGRFMGQGGTAIPELSPCSDR